MLVGGDSTPPWIAPRNHRRQNLGHPPHLQDGYLRLRLEPPFLERETRCEVRGRAESANADFLAAQFFGLADLCHRDDGKKRRIDETGDDHGIGPGEPRGEDRLAVDLRERYVPPDERRERLRTAADVDQF